jgi:predicted permease
MNWIKQLFSRRRLYSDLSEEMQEHLEEKTEELVKAGMSRKEAFDSARREFGNALLFEERGREVWRWPTIESILADVRYGFRQLRNAPGFTLVCVLTLALGIGANTAIFTLLHAVMLKSLPVSNPQQLYRLGDDQYKCCVYGGLQDSWGIFSYSLYQQLRDQASSFEELAAFQASTTRISVRRNGVSRPPDSFVGTFVSGNYFAMFGIQAFAGRTFTSADDATGAAPVVVISHRAWEQNYGSDSSLVGSTVMIDGISFTVAGIAPPGFFGSTLRTDPPDFWMPLATEPMVKRQSTLLNSAGLHWLHIMGRIRPGADTLRLQSQLTVELQRWLNSPAGNTTFSRGSPSVNAKAHIDVTPSGGGMTELKNSYASGLRLLMIISGLVLIIACANIANLLLARGTSNRLKISLRLALGAPRTRLIRQMLTESLLLAVLGGLAGLLIAYGGTRAILALAFHGEGYVPISPNPSLPILAFTFMISVATGILFGVVPAWMASHSDPIEALHGANRSTNENSSLRKSLVIFQAALSLVLLAGAGLFTKSLNNLQNQQLGFETQGRFIVKVSSTFSGYTPERLDGVYQQLRQKLAQLPGVISASYALYGPMVGNRWSTFAYIEGRAPDSNDGPGDNTTWDRVGPNYFETIGTHLLRGRTIEEQDTPTSRHVAVINQAFARKFFKDEDPIGRHFGVEDVRYSGNYEIVGVVEDAKYQNPKLPVSPMLFLPFLQITNYQDPGARSAEVRSNYLNDIELRVAAKSANLEPVLRKTLADIDSNLTVIDITSFNEQVSQNFNQQRLIARLTGLFGFLALVLASVGLYGVTAYSVVRRTREIGVRIALGADRTSVVSMVLRGAFVQVGLGLAIGIPVALIGGRLISSQLYAMKGYDALVLAGATLILAASALVAGLVPARRAAAIDPIQALRTE